MKGVKISRKIDEGDVDSAKAAMSKFVTKK